MGGQLFAGRYRIVRRLAQGGMGVVFVAEHLATERQVALKVLWPHVLGSKNAVSGFKREARLNARIDSEHVVRVLDAGFDDGLSVPFLAMELLRGVTLRALVGETGPLAPAEALAVLRQVAKALDKAHGCVDREGRPSPIVHRDLKPENLFVALREGGDVVVKVLDFGLAKVLSENQHLSHEVKGTPAFMACEQFAPGPVTPQLDIWAFGLIAFYLLAGRVYWASSTPNAPEFTPLLNEILLQPLVPPSERAVALGLPRTWPAGFDAWFLRCLEREPSARFASAGAAALALTEVFASGAGLTEAAIAAACSGLTSKAASVFERSQETAPVAEATTLPEESSLSLMRVADLLGPERSGPAPLPSKTLLLEAQPSRVAPQRAWARRGVVAGGALALLGAVVAWQGGMSKGEASASPSGAAVPLEASAVAPTRPFFSLSPPTEPTILSDSAPIEPTLGALPVSAPTERGAAVAQPPVPRPPPLPPVKPKAPEKAPNADSASESTPTPKPQPSSAAPSRNPREVPWLSPLGANER